VVVSLVEVVDDSALGLGVGILQREVKVEDSLFVLLTLALEIGNLICGLARVGFLAEALEDIVPLLRDTVGLRDYLVEVQCKCHVEYRCNVEGPEAARELGRNVIEAEHAVIVTAAF